MEAALVKLVWDRAAGLCEYCRMPQAYDELPFEIDHVLPRHHGGRTVASNLALACFACNRHRGSNLSGVDGKTKKITRLFHPRRHSWPYHFRWDGPSLAGRTPIGRATLAVLAINLSHRVRHREQLMLEHVFPPPPVD